MALLLFFGFITLCSTVIEANLRDCIIARDVCPNEHVTFWLRKRTTEEAPVERTEKPYVSNELKVLIHGYKGNRTDRSMEVLGDAYFNKKELVILIVDWGNLAKKYCYKEALRNYPVVGKCTARMVKILTEGETSFNYTHVIGFGLGAHVAGVVGHGVQNLDRITGLDPARKGFSGNSTHLKDRLDSSDAVFVDVYHSNSGKKGMQEPLGDTDFYLNNGKAQPGCIKSSCSHYRAVEVFAESISNAEGFPGRRCDPDLGPLSGIKKYFKEVCPYSENSMLVKTVTAGEYAKKGFPGSFKIETNKKSFW